MILQVILVAETHSTHITSKPWPASGADHADTSDLEVKEGLLSNISEVTTKDKSLKDFPTTSSSEETTTPSCNPQLWRNLHHP